MHKELTTPITAEPLSDKSEKVRAELKEDAKDPKHQESDFEKAVKKLIEEQNKMKSAFEKRVKELVDLQHQINDKITERDEFIASGDTEHAMEMSGEICDLRNQLANIKGFVDIDAVFNMDDYIATRNSADGIMPDKIWTQDLADKTILTDKEALLFSIDDKGNVGRKVDYKKLDGADLDKDGTLDRQEISTYVDTMSELYPNAIDDYYSKEAIRSELGIDYVEQGDEVASSYKYNFFNGDQHYDKAKTDGYYVDFNETKFFRHNNFYEFLKDPNTENVDKNTVDEFYKRYNLDDLSDLKQLQSDMSSGKSFEELYNIEDIKQEGDNNLNPTEQQETTDDGKGAMKPEGQDGGENSHQANNGEATTGIQHGESQEASV